MDDRQSAMTMWRDMRGKNYSLSVVIAAVNESKTIAEVIQQVRLLRIIDEITVVDDGSTDDTPAIAKRMGCKVLKSIELHEKKIGQTRSIKRGLDVTRTDLIVTMDADLEHLPSDIPKLLAMFDEKDADVVIGCRHRLPRISERLMSRMIRHATGVTDTISGFKLISRRALDHVEYDEDETWGSLFLIRCAKKGLKVVEVPVQTPTRRIITKTGGKLNSNLKIFKAIIKDILCIFGLL